MIEAAFLAVGLAVGGIAGFAFGFYYCLNGLARIGKRK